MAFFKLNPFEKTKNIQKGFRLIYLVLIICFKLVDSKAQELFISDDKFKMIELNKWQLLGANYGAILRKSPDADSEVLDRICCVNLKHTNKSTQTFPHNAS